MICTTDQKKWVNVHLSIDNACKHSILLLQSLLQVHEGELVVADLESVISEKHSWKPTVTLLRQLWVFIPSAPVKPVTNGQRKYIVTKCQKTCRRYGAVHYPACDLSLATLKYIFFKNILWHFGVRYEPSIPETLKYWPSLSCPTLVIIFIIITWGRNKIKSILFIQRCDMSRSKLFSISVFKYLEQHWGPQDKSPCNRGKDDTEWFPLLFRHLVQPWTQMCLQLCLYTETAYRLPLP